MCAVHMEKILSKFDAIVLTQCAAVVWRPHMIAKFVLGDLGFLTVCFGMSGSYINQIFALLIEFVILLTTVIMIELIVSSLVTQFIRHKLTAHEVFSSNL